MPTPSSILAEPNSVKTLGPYTLVRQLGKGGMGEVWLARRTAIGGASKALAIKTLLPERARESLARRMFLDEARLSMLLTNSNIVQVFDVGEADDGTGYMAMELVRGLDLAKLSKHLANAGEKLPTPLIAFIIGEMLKALAYAHELEHEGTIRTLVHRDISPHNVMLSVNGEVKLMDFGIARLASEDTSRMHVKGKLRYMPPEQLRGNTREGTIDLFAVGAVLHELLDGKRFRGDVIDEERLVGMILAGEVPPLESPHELPLELERLRAGLLASAVNDRIPSARAAYCLLSHWTGYRDAKFELADLVRRFVDAERSHADVSAAGVITISAELEQPEDDGSSTGSTVIETSGMTAKSADIATIILGPAARLNHPPERAKAEDTATVSEPAPAANREGRSHGRKRGVLMLAAIALGAGVFVSGETMSWSRDERGAAMDVAHAQLSLPPSEPEPAPAFAQPAPLAPVFTRPAPVETPPADTQTKPVKISKKLSKKIPVTITSPGYRFWVQIEISGKTYTLDRLEGTNSASARLEPGNYEVRLREEPGGVWRSVGQVTVPRAGKVRLELRAGGKALVTR